MKKLFGKKGFTLVEMLIVVVIIGILAAALIPKLTGAQARARDAARKANLNQATAAVATYFSDNGKYPGIGSSGTAHTGTQSLTEVKSDLVPAYINSIPADPQSSKIVKLINGRDSEAGQYAYAPITRNSTKYAGMVLGANIESEGANANWVVLQADVDSGAGGNVPEDAKVKDTINLCEDGDFGCTATSLGYISSSDTPSEATEAIELEKTICNKVKIDSSSNSGMADSNNCKAKTNNDMVYLVIQ